MDKSKYIERPPKTFDPTAYKSKFAKENYDRIILSVKKGKKEEIKRQADAVGKSVNQYIIDLIDADMCGD